MYMCIPSSSDETWNCGSLEHALLWSLMQDWIWSPRFWRVVWAGILIQHRWHTIQGPWGNTFSISIAVFWQTGHTTSSSKLFCNISENISSSLASSISYSAIISSSGKVIEGCSYTFINISGTTIRCLTHTFVCVYTVSFNVQIHLWNTVLENTECNTPPLCRAT
jgi:hypothetical protein